MDKALIERLAAAAEFDTWRGTESKWAMTPEQLANFAALVAEECAKECDYWQSLTDQNGFSNQSGVYIAAAIRAIFAKSEDN